MTTPVSTADTAAFEASRSRLRGLAYRMLGSLSEADDVVQETWLRWQATERSGIAVPEAWLTTVATRLTLDLLRSARVRRESYPGPWLPEPLISEPGPLEAAELADSLTLGFLVLLDQLQPVERAVFVLADVFDVPYSQIAGMVGRSEVACRQIASRARRRVRDQRRPRDHPTGSSRRLLDELVAAIASGDIDRVVQRLAPDVVCTSDGGPDRRAARRPVVGAERVARLLVNLTKRHAAEPLDLRAVTVNGDPGLLVSLSGRLDQVLAVETDDATVTAIRIVRNPDKLTGLGSSAQLD